MVGSGPFKFIKEEHQPGNKVVYVVVADRIERWARIAGRENVIFGNDCGFQSTAGNTEIPVTVAWAKLQALGEGARIASKRIW
jgi:5-methyltetrahydropteroyltriglutamate--homocysteine methyltransferase